MTTIVHAISTPRARIIGLIGLTFIACAAITGFLVIADVEYAVSTIFGGGISA